MMRGKVGVAVAVLCAACSSTAAPRSPGPAVASPNADAGPALASPSPVADAIPDASAAERDAREDRRIAKMMKRVSEARALPALKPVPGVVLARDALLAQVRAHLEREVPPEAITHEGLELQLFGFLPTSFDYLAATFELLDAQLAGFYEPSDSTMYMAADLDGTNAEATLAHELDHALQDQHFDLKAHSKYEAGKSDAQSAYDALAEGDATSAMADVLFAKMMPGKTALDLPDDAFEANVLGSMGGAGGTGDVPSLMKSSLIAPYLVGTRFVNALRRAGGWSAVDAAWKDLPTTSEQILHVEKWRTHEPALDVTVPTFAALGGGWTAVDIDTTGELGLRLAFAEWMGVDRAKLAAAGWGGDHDVLLENGDKAAAAIHVRYDAGRKLGGKDDPFTLLTAGLEASLGKVTAKSPGWACIERPQLGPLAVLKHERELVLIAGPVKHGDAWAAAGDCALAKRWAAEVAAQK
jgi:hypothetical protein